MYVASRFLVLAQGAGDPELVPDGLVDLLYEEIATLWERTPAWQYGRDPFPNGMRERVKWKLSTKTVPRSYYRSIFDEELFVFAIAADLRTWERLSGSRRSSTVADVLSVANQVFYQEIVQLPGGGWLFQPGVFRDHPDYRYAGQTAKVAGMVPKPLTDVAADSSHSHRFPLWLTSLMDAYELWRPEKAYYARLKEGLATQFLTRVLVRPTPSFPAFRTTNYMDGRNGIYRWNYSTTGRNNGYGPYELSSPLVTLPGTLEHGFYELLARLAAKI